MRPLELAQDPGAPIAVPPKGEAKRTFSKTHANYWKVRLEHRTYTRDGKTFEIAEWSVRIHFKGIRKNFDLESANKEEAAAKARDIYLSLVSKGWSATLTDPAPQTMAPIEAKGGNPTVGDFLAEVERTSTLKLKTFRRYAQYLRMLAAQIQGVESGASRYNYRTGGLTRWRDRVNAIPLSVITPAVVADWKILYLKRAGNDPRRKLEVNRSFNAALRHCKSLFSEKIINKPNFAVKIPKFKVPDGQRGEREVYWFETVDFEKAGSMKFHSPAGVTYESLVRNARNELRSASPEAYKLFLLCLCAGLRRTEADVCLWSQLNPQDNSIQIEANKYIEPKHGSGGTVYVDGALMKELLSFKEQTLGDFLVNSKWEWKPTAYTRYRCEPHWQTLLDWLESNGIAARKKIHELRKLFGDAIVKQNGIFAGSAQLRHATIQMETKAKFISQVMSGDMTIRRLEDLDSAALTYAEVKAIASGNPLVIEKAQVDAELIRLTRLRSAHAEEQYRIRTNLRRSHEDAETFTARLSNLREDIKTRQETSGDKFRIELEGQTLDNRGVAGELLVRRAEKLKGCFGDDVRVGRFAGFDLFLRSGFNNTVEVVLRGKNSYNARVTDTALGTIRSVEATVQGFEERDARLESDISDAHKRAKELEIKVGAPFEKEARYQELTRRQNEIEEKLDLTKNQAPSQAEAISVGDNEPKNSETQNVTKAVRPKRRVAMSV